MNWFSIALIAPALFAASNVIDKHLLNKYFQEEAIGAMLIFSALTGIIILPPILYFEPQIYMPSNLQRGALILSGFLTIVCLIPYFHALKEDDASIVTPLFQTIPVFSLFSGYLFLGEILTKIQLAGSAFIILGSIALTLNLNHPRFAPKWRILGLMLLSSFVYSSSSIVFKGIFNECNFWSVIFWEYLGTLLAGIMFLLIPAYRKPFFQLLTKKWGNIIGVNILNELAASGGTLVSRFAITLAPVALIQSIEGLSPAFTLFYTVILTLFFPSILTEDFSGRKLKQKLVGILTLVAGSILVNL